MSIYLNRLKQILVGHDEKYLFYCIKELVTKGLDTARFSSEKHRPSRQDITQYIAAWFKYIGIYADECRDWMIEYSVEVLSKISSSSNSQIRHSTKSNIKYIFNSDVSFECGCENNIFKASCDRNCPVYEEMMRKNKERETREANRTYEPEPINLEPEIERLSVKETYRDQYKKAMEIIQDQVKKGLSSKSIVTALNERGLKTRTGKKWTYPVLHYEIRGHNYEPEAKDIEAGRHRPSIKDRHKDQFEKAREFMQDQAKKGLSKQDIVTVLNERGLRTRTGRKWTYHTLQIELKKLMC